MSIQDESEQIAGPVDSAATRELAPFLAFTDRAAFILFFGITRVISQDQDLVQAFIKVIFWATSQVWAWIRCAVRAAR